MKSKGQVLLGMSGGVDSSVAALLLKKQGYKVIGAFLKVFSETKNKLTGECAWVEERKSAQKIAAQLNIPLITLDFEKKYRKKVINPMFKAYASGLTPNPDISCNTIIKFPLLWEAAKKHNANYIATGHYARIKKTKSGFRLLSGKDKTKDQSYFLAELKQTDLKHTLFPIGNYTKKQIRKIARNYKFPNWNKPGTSGICFVGKIDMRQFLKKHIKEESGLVKTPEKTIVGLHSGTAYYTIGQKVGPHIGIEIHKPKEHATQRWYVAEKRKNNILIVAPEGHPALRKREVILHKPNFITKNTIPKGIKARIRHLGKLHAGKLVKKESKFHFIFAKPVEAIAEGQYLVLYHKNQVIGAGEIRLK